MRFESLNRKEAEIIVARSLTYLEVPVSGLVEAGKKSEELEHDVF